jgi:hypothetical protein
VAAETARAPGRLPRLAVALALLGLACASAAPPPPAAVWEGGDVRVELEYRGEAEAVSIVGDFNDWDPARHPFERMAAERWRVVLRLPPGRHVYLLSVTTDRGRRLRTDPANFRRTRDVFGRELSLLVLDGDHAGDGEGR